MERKGIAMSSKYLSINQASKETGKSVSTIHGAIKSGRISYISREGNSYQIEPSELFRVFPKKDNKKEEEQGGIGEKTMRKSIELEHQVQLLQSQLDSEKEKSRMLEDKAEFLKNNCDDWKKQAQTLLLTTERKVKKGIMNKLFSKK